MIELFRAVIFPIVPTILETGHSFCFVNLPKCIGGFARWGARILPIPEVIEFFRSNIEGKLGQSLLLGLPHFIEELTALFGSDFDGARKPPSESAI